MQTTIRLRNILIDEQQLLQLQLVVLSILLMIAAGPHKYQCTALASSSSNNNARYSNSNKQLITDTQLPQQPPQQPRKPIPITVLSGFLGSGKTTLLQNLLDNRENLKIAVIVNDVAAVNIDSKQLVQQRARDTSNNNNAGAAEILELQNGCACCSLSDELLASVAELVTLSDLRGEEDANGAFDHIVVEMSGVADPKSVRSKFQEAEVYDMPLLDRVQLDTMVTLVDCSSFLDYMRSDKTANAQDAPELFYREGEEALGQEDEGSSIPNGLLETLGMGIFPGNNDEESGVADLIVSQVETADVVLVNKVDLAGASDVSEIEEIIQALNPRATLFPTQFGKVPLSRILAVAKGRGIVQAGAVDDHKDAVHAASCDDPNCTDPSHSHHLHSHADKDVFDSDNVSAGHSHAHDHSSSTNEIRSNDQNVGTNPVSSHSRSHEHSHQTVCTDPDCTDSTHTHSHDHSTTSNHTGIGSFVYRARRPFHPERLLRFLRGLPIKRGLPDDSDCQNSLKIKSAAKQVLGRVVRSKGFTWIADSHAAALYWSHAGSSFELSCLGSWWATLPREQWPPEAVSTILQDFDSHDHNEEGASCETVGDRRQEIVFIGQTLGDPASQVTLSEALDQCLLDEPEWSRYIGIHSDEDKLCNAFPTRIKPTMASY